MFFFIVCVVCLFVYLFVVVDCFIFYVVSFFWSGGILIVYEPEFVQ